LASLIVEEARQLANTAVLYFYCRQCDADRNTFVAMARSLLWQLLDRNNDLVEHLYLASVKSGELTLGTQKLARELLETTLQAVGKTCIVVDGLDECTENEQKLIAKFLRDFVNKSGSGAAASRCVFLSQYDESTRALLSKLPKLPYGQSDNRGDIEGYCKHESRVIQSSFGLDAGFASKLATDVAKFSDGMCPMYDLCGKC
jgi:hypothetical protein